MGRCSTSFTTLGPHIHTNLNLNPETRQADKTHSVVLVGGTRIVAGRKTGSFTYSEEHREHRVFVPWGITGDTTARGLRVERFVVMQYRTLPTYTFKESERVEEYLFAGGPGLRPRRVRRGGASASHTSVSTRCDAQPLSLTLSLSHSHNQTFWVFLKTRQRSACPWGSLFHLS